MNAITTRTFKSGNSEAVRLPKGFGFGAGTELKIEREGNRLVLTALDEADAWRRDAAALATDLDAIRGGQQIARGHGLAQDGART
ncbi:MAG: AbrB/MazE/SpoVT family DNA-binding domain-containing protein, partial [Sphingomonadales bacterium]